MFKVGDIVQVRDKDWVKRNCAITGYFLNKASHVYGKFDLDRKEKTCGKRFKIILIVLAHERSKSIPIYIVKDDTNKSSPFFMQSWMLENKIYKSLAKEVA